MLLVSHILPEVERSCDRLLVFAGGQVRADAPPDALAGRVAGDARYIVEAKRADGSNSPAEVLRKLGWVRELDAREVGGGWMRCGFTFGGEDRREDVARALNGAGVLVRELRAEQPTLEQAYLRLIADSAPPMPSEDGGEGDGQRGRVS